MVLRFTQEWSLVKLFDSLFRREKPPADLPWPEEKIIEAAGKKLQELQWLVHCVGFLARGDGSGLPGSEARRLQAIAKLLDDHGY